MKKRTWLITGISSGFGHELTRQLLEKGDKVIGTVRLYL
jgi:NAD(P)-dependent dehydrogenase (short-subunit alcohol dehydrogenase family)